jgi:hypothetical protein
MYRMNVWSVSLLLSLTVGVGSCSRVHVRSEDTSLLSTGLVGWQQVEGEQGSWKLENGVLYTDGGNGWLSTVRQYDDFLLALEFRLPPAGNSGIFIRAPHEGDPAYNGLEIQILDDSAEQWSDLRADQYTGSIYDVQAPSERAGGKADEWQKMVIECRGSRVRVAVNGKMVIDTNMDFYPYKFATHPGLTRRSGYIGLQNHGSKVEFRNIRLRELVEAMGKNMGLTGPIGPMMCCRDLWAAFVIRKW